MFLSTSRSDLLAIPFFWLNLLSCVQRSDLLALTACLRVPPGSLGIDPFRFLNRVNDMGRLSRWSMGGSLFRRTMAIAHPLINSFALNSFIPGFSYTDPRDLFQHGVISTTNLTGLRRDHTNETATTRQAADHTIPGKNARPIMYLRLYIIIGRTWAID